ncbi:MAG: hypothetical protein V4580_19880 [Bacteroidota bacterium]
MSKKKRVSTAHLQKVESLQRRNQFFERLKQFCDQVTDVPVFQFISQAHLDEIYELRVHPIRVRAAKGQDVPVNVLKEIKSFVTESLKKTPVHIGVGQVKDMPLHDFMTIGFTLILYAGRLKINDYQKAELVKSKLLPLRAFTSSDTFNKSFKGYFDITDKVSLLKSDLGSAIYVLREDESEEYNNNSGIYFCLDVYCVKTPKIQVSIEGMNRPAYRVGWLLPDDPSLFTPVSIDMECLGFPSNVYREVYIQSHALDRLSERVDGVDKGFLHFSIYNSLQQANVRINKKREWLFEFRLSGKKVGYFKGDLVDGKIILRTFLFLTNNGTPEGEKLHEHTGIMKEDKMYLTIDKFSSFVHSDIKDNERVKEIFVKAGCESLFDIDPLVCVGQAREYTLAVLIENYLKAG